MNLVHNAIKYTEAEGRVVVAARRFPGGEVTMTVSDTGLGIPTDQQTRIFERFFRADNVVKKEAHGCTGLGLWIAKSIVEAHGGTLAFSSQEGKGTTFVPSRCRPDPSAEGIGQCLRNMI